MVRGSKCINHLELPLLKQRCHQMLNTDGHHLRFQLRGSLLSFPDCLSVFPQCLVAGFSDPLCASQRGQNVPENVQSLGGGTSILGCTPSLEHPEGLRRSLKVVDAK